MTLVCFIWKMFRPSRVCGSVLYKQTLTGGSLNNEKVPLLSPGRGTLTNK